MVCPRGTPLMKHLDFATRTRRGTSRNVSSTRRARIEPLETRRLLAASIAVTSELGGTVDDGSVTPSPDNGTDFGTFFVGDQPASRTFMVANSSDTDDLMLGNLNVPAGFAV